MKSTFTHKAIVAAVSAVVVISAANAFQTNQTKQVVAGKQTIQQVTVAAKRMSPEEKLAFDLQSTGMQTVIISAKRLTPERKLAMDAQDRAWQSAAKNKAITKG